VTLKRHAAAILAGGTGTRMGESIPKQFLELDGIPIIIRTLDSFVRSPVIGRIVVAIHPDWLSELKKLLVKQFPETPIACIPGGDTRQASSWAALNFLTDSLPVPDIVLIHDAARCLIDTDLIGRCAQAAVQFGASTSAVPAVDTLACIENERIVHIPPRTDYVHIQTPQAFRLPLIREAHLSAMDSGEFAASDDAQLVLNIGQEVFVTPGNRTNIKISNPEDLETARRLLKHLEKLEG